MRICYWSASVLTPPPDRAADSPVVLLPSLSLVYCGCSLYLYVQGSKETEENGYDHQIKNQTEKEIRLVSSNRGWATEEHISYIGGLV